MESSFCFFAHHYLVLSVSLLGGVGILSHFLSCAPSVCGVNFIIIPWRALLFPRTQFSPGGEEEDPFFNIASIDRFFLHFNCLTIETNYVFNIMDDVSVKEILRLAHKLPSPRSVTDTATAPLQDDDNAAMVNRLAKEFLDTVVRCTFTIMEHNRRMTVHPTFVSQALEYFIKFDVAPYRHSYMLDNSNEEPEGSQESEESSDQSAWSVKDGEDEIMDEDDHHLDPESEVESDNDEDDEMSFAFVRNKLNDKSSPNFDATFEPVGKINLSDEDFLRGNLIDVMHSMNIDIEWAGGADGKLKSAMYAFLVAQIK